MTQTADGASATAARTIPQTMRASVLTTVQTIELEDRPVPAPDPDQVLVRVEAVGLCGSDVHWYQEGHIGDLYATEPIILGHESAGTIVAVGSSVDPVRIGQRVSIEPQRTCRVCAYCKRGEYNLCPKIEFYGTPPIDGAFTEYVTIQADFAWEVPDELSTDAAALLEPLSCAIAAVRKAKIVPGSSVLITGCGPIGLICAQTAKAYGASEIWMTDLVKDRRDRALAMIATPDVTMQVIDPITQHLPEAYFNAFIDATGALPAVRDGIFATARGGAAVIVGLGDDDMSLPVGAITTREVNVTGIFRYNNTWPTAIDLARSGRVDLDSMVTGRYGLAEVEDAIKNDTRPETLKSIIEPTR